MCKVNVGLSFSATWGSETPEPIHLKSGMCDYCNLTRTLLHHASCIFVFGPRQLYLLHGVPRFLARRRTHFPWWIAGSAGQEFTRYEFDEE